MSNYTLDVLIEGYDESKAQELLSDQNEVNQDWIDVYESRQNTTILQAEVQGIEEKTYSMATKKKMLCAMIDIGTVRGMIPLDFLEVEDRKQARKLIGEKVAFVVIAVDRENGFFVGSRKQALQQMADKTLKKIDKGDIIPSVVREVYNANMVLDIGGIQCRVPTSDVTYGWIDNLHDYYKVGDHVKVKVMDLDKKKRSVKVSIKETKPNEWERVHDYYKEFGEYVAKVSGVSEFGTFVTLREGISGLAQHLRHEVVKKGDKVLIRVLKIKQKEQKMNVKILKVF
jgi:small subunit ribosomal protein S1